MRYEILDISNNVINTIRATEQFVEANCPGLYRLVVEEEPTIPIETRMTRLQFQLRFTFNELVAIETAAETNPAVRVLQKQQQVAEFIDVADENTQLGIMYLVSIELLTSQRGNEILTI